ncbi:MAG: NADPH-dependent FMN reductase [Thermosynechococcaceae cyanobacterium]
MNILALCGSLRSQSWCAALLRATQAMTPADVNIHIFEVHGLLPLFNPDLEANAPDIVVSLWEAVTAADAIVIASPEYAHGITGTMKNTLDWLVGHIPFAGKPVAVFNPTFQSHHADDAIKEILRTMSADLIEKACVRIPVIGSGLDQDGIINSPEFATTISLAIQAILTHVQQVRMKNEA